MIFYQTVIDVHMSDFCQMVDPPVDRARTVFGVSELTIRARHIRLVSDERRMAEVRVVRRASASASARARRLWRRAKSGASAAGRRVASWKWRWSSRASETTRVETASEEASTAQTSAPSEPAAFASGCVPSLRSRRARRGTRREAHSPSPRRRGVDGEDAVASSGKRANASDDDDDDNAEEPRACPSDAAPPRTPRSDEEPKPTDEESTETSPARRRERGGAEDARDEPSNRANLPGWVASPVARLSQRVVSREDRRDEEVCENGERLKTVKDFCPESSLREARSRSPSSRLARLAALSANVDSRFEGLDSRVHRGSAGGRQGGRDGENSERRETTPSTETEGPLHALVKSVVARQKTRAGDDDASDDDGERRRAKDADSNKENDDDALRRATTSRGASVSFVSSPKTPKTRSIFFRSDDAVFVDDHPSYERVVSRTKTPSAFSAARAIPRFERVASRSDASLNDRQTGGGFVVTKALLEDENAKRLALGSLFDSEELALSVKEDDARSHGRRDAETEEEETRVFAALEALVTRAERLF